MKILFLSIILFIMGWFVADLCKKISNKRKRNFFIKSIPDETKSCRERKDHWQNCHNCPDLSCCDNMVNRE